MDDVVMFDVPPLLQLRGKKEYKKTLELFYMFTSGGKDAFKLPDLELFTSGDVAYGYPPLHVANDTARLTLGFRRVGVTWLITHEHHSFSAG